MKTLPLAIVACLLVHPSLNAATVTLTPRVSAILNMDFTPTGSEFPGPGRDYLLQVDVYLRIDGLPDDAHGFSNTAFNSAIHGTGASLYVDEALGIPAWNPNNPQFDSNGPAPGGIVNKWDINSDDGAPNDLQGVILANITKGFGPPQYDPRRNLGEGPEGEHAGSFYVSLPCSLPVASAAVEILAAFGASTYDANGVSTTVGNEAIGGTTERFFCAPEPSSWILLGLGSALPLIALRRRRARSLRAARRLS